MPTIHELAIKLYDDERDSLGLPERFWTPSEGFLRQHGAWYDAEAILSGKDADMMVDTRAVEGGFSL